ncbi:uncharacterized protein EDB93DRAFT_1248556 [Suillus bovinus]|uniref:uncharacterized protein n=1 Tax=Suillus bovinus TaxID=48563 RepID=UPI001B885519|nr:uncharacterized protein EDB93DRAFT_1248556 [Suillus bovinus]KAG2153656.1 hypothetical protein EDB93DRAFT_1248556 [Suillus bovinus]
MEEPQVDIFGMPWACCSTAPHFSGDATKLIDFLESVERLTQPLSLSDKDIIKYALKYSAQNERELFQTFKGNNFKDFANEALYCYPGHGTCYYTHPKITKFTPIEAPLDALPLHAPLQLKCAPAQLLSKAISPVCKIREATLTSAPPEPFFIEIVSPSAQIVSPTISKPQEHHHVVEPQGCEAILPVCKIHEAILTPACLEPSIVRIASPPVEIESPIISIPQVHPPKAEYQGSEAIMPMCEIHEAILATACLELSIIKTVSPSVYIEAPIMYQEELKCNLPLSVPHCMHYTPLEEHYATLIYHSLSQEDSLLTDDFALFAFSEYIEDCLPVKHPCITSPKHHVSDNPDASLMHYYMRDRAKGSLEETLYIQFSHFSSFSHFSLTTSDPPVAATFPKDCNASQDYLVDGAHAFTSRLEDYVCFCIFRILPASL